MSLSQSEVVAKGNDIVAALGASSVLEMPTVNGGWWRVVVDGEQVNLHHDSMVGRFYAESRNKCASVSENRPADKLASEIRRRLGIVSRETEDADIAAMHYLAGQLSEALGEEYKRRPINEMTRLIGMRIVKSAEKVQVAYTVHADYVDFDVRFLSDEQAKALAAALVKIIADDRTVLDVLAEKPGAVERLMKDIEESPEDEWQRLESQAEATE